MSFANPYFLAALAGIAVPILIHLFTRDHVKHVAFSTLRFFAKGAKLVVQRKRFQELLLIVLRAAVVALLALVFARPFLRSKVAETGDAVGTARVIVTDVSGSMRRAGLPDALRKEAESALDGLKEGEDAAALLSFADAPNIEEPLGKNISQVKAAAEHLTPGYGGTNIADALRKANEILRGVHAKEKEIVLVSDLQKQGWHYFKGDWKLAADVKLTVRALKSQDAGAGVGIVEASAPGNLVLDKQPASIAVRIANFSEQPRNDLDVTLMLNGSKADAQRVNIRPNGTVAVRFRHVFDTPGDNTGSVIIGKDAASAGGYVFYFNARILPRIPVLLVNGRPSSNPQNDAAFFIGKALAPTEASPFAVKTVAAGKVTPGDIAVASVVVFADAGQIPATAAGALPAFLNRGGGIFFLPGGEVKADAFNSQFGRVAPCKLRKILQARPANGETAESLTRVDFEHPIFEAFALPHHGDLSLPKFAKYWETTDTQASRVLARFGDGRPAIMEREIGKGVSVALVSAMDPDWNDFALQSVFLPYIHQTTRYLAVRTGQRTAFACGDVLPVSEGASLKGPDGKAKATGDVIASQPGIYQVLNNGGKPEICYAVNGSFAETDPATMAADEIAAAVERAPGEVLGSLDLDAAPALAHGKKDGGLWWWLLCGLLVLSLAELVVGNRTLRH